MPLNMLFLQFSTKALLQCLGSVALIFSLTSCSGTYHAYKNTLQLAFTKQPDASLTLAQINSATFDYLYVTHGERSQSLLALMFIEQQQFKWISADESMLITEKGRIVRTLGFNNDLLQLTANNGDPIADVAKITATTHWQRNLDWAADEYGYRVSSKFAVETGHSLHFFDQGIAVTKVIEYLSYDSASDYLRFDKNWKNVFWFDASSGELLQSQQQLAPFTEPMQLIFISQVARELAKQSPTSEGH